VLPATPPPPPSPSANAVEVSYDKGLLFRTPDEKFEAKVAVKSQARFESVRSFEDGGEFESRFYLPRVRLAIDGNVYGKENRYKLEFGLGDRGSFGYVRDFFVERKVADLWLRVGLWKRPFSRQELNSDFASTFNERSVANDLAGGGRDVGIAIHNDYEKSPEGLEWVVGLFNGFSGGGDRPRTTTSCTQDPDTLVITCTTGPATNFPTDFSPTGVIRVGYNHGKVKGYQEVDLDGGPLRWGVAANYKVDLADLSEGDEESVGDNLSHGVGIDGVVKVEGFDVTAGGFLMKLKSADAELGGYVQGGYVVVPKRVHVAGRFAFAGIADSDEVLLEGRAALSYYFAGHAVKVASDIGILKVTGDGTDPELQIRIMPQLTF
jgi:hypothetical protein